ncbi:prosaposin isoform X2 [Ambystoma mexicanum]|uniref:prosaposin isoform X2 n=1 Tax=Ambystoma mexicanum TaxID=8296 RepID=UPI0037E7771D
MKFLLVLPLLLASVVSIPLLGKEQCVHGPTFWCHNLQTASQCGAVKHCQQNVWNKPTVKNVICDLCKQTISVIDNILKDNATETKALEFLQKLCELVPSKDLSLQCKEMVNAYLPEVFNIIKEEMENPGVICCALRLCTSLQHQLGEEKQHQLKTNEIPETELPKAESPFIANLPFLLFPPNKPQQEGDVCKDCIQFITDVVDALKTNSSFLPNYLESLKKDCDAFAGSMAETCKNMISEYSDVVVQMLIQMKPTAVCCMAGFCHDVADQPLVPTKVIPAVKLVKAIQAKSQPQESVQCVVCQMLIGKIEEMIADNKTKEHIEEILDKACSLLPTEYSAECKDMVHSYGPAILDLLLAEMKPKTICCALGLCSNRPQQLQNVIAPKNVKSDFCEVCKMILKYLDMLLEKNATQAQIEKKLKMVCNFMPFNLQKECDDYISLYSQELLQVLLIEMDPTLVCMASACEGTPHLLGTEECTFGPSYWCKNMETATNCNAVEHCTRHIWN